MLVFYIMFCCIAPCYAANGRAVQCILGRNISFSLTANRINKDAFVIFHGSSLILSVWPFKNQSLPNVHDERLRINVDKSSYNTVTVAISIMNVTQTDAGIYKMERYWSSEEVLDSVLVQECVTLPWIAMVPRIIPDSTIVLQCISSTSPTESFGWKLNGYVIESRGRYAQNRGLLYIKNITSNDKDNLYTCNEFGRGLESDPFKLNTSGPNAIQFVPSVTVAKEQEWLNISCLTDCYPICTWNWSKLDLSSALGKTITTDRDLQLNNITRNDAGRYSCKVYNIITNTSFEAITYLDVVYGPDEPYTNISDTTIQLDESDTIAIVCYANCFPLCQISWTETNSKIMRTGAELKLSNVENDVNYTCHAKNPSNSNSVNSKTIYIKVKLGRNYFQTTTTISGNREEDFPSKLHFWYVLLGVGVILAVGLFACLLHKYRFSSHVRRNRNSTPVTIYNKDCGEEATEEKSTSGNYWTIVSDERGKMSTAIETESKQCNTPTQKTKRRVIPKQHKLKQSISVIDDDAVIELDEYLDPIHVGADERDDYIHPVHSGPVTIDLSSGHHTTEL